VHYPTAAEVGTALSSKPSGVNMTALYVRRAAPRWGQFIDWPYLAGDLFVLGLLVA
jgi:hypothetical protein